jgi:hydrogenase small subunit
MRLKRRDFLKAAGMLGAGAAVEALSGDLRRVYAQVADGRKHLIWLVGSCDSGCTISWIQGVSPDLVDVLQQFRLAVDFNPTLMIPSGDAAVKALNSAAWGTVPLDVLVVEGAVPAGNFCSVGESAGSPVPFETWVKRLAVRAKSIVAVGTCASFGGISAAQPNPTRCLPVSPVVSPKKVINIPGCPAHPDWITLTLADVLSGTTPALDGHGRPTVFFRKEVHELCPLKENDDVFAPSFSQAGCLRQLGCRGPITKADCPTRLWNNRTSFCISGPRSGGSELYPAGAPCIGCTEPGFPDPPFSPFYKRNQGDD